MSSDKISVQLRRLCAGALTAALLAVPVLADTIGGAKVSAGGSGLNLRSDAGTDYASMAVIPDGSFLLVEEELDGWYKVAYNGKSGYVSSDYAVFSETLDGAYGFSAATSGNSVNMRSGADISYGVVKCLWSMGTALNITGVSGNWLKVRDAAGSEGYIRSDLLRYSAAPASVAETRAEVGGTVGEQLVATAKQYLGYNYSWGGMSPETGFDCSGFVNYIYNLYGYSLNRVAQSIYNNDGVSVSKEELRPGDLLFFGGGGYVGHVGIYAGNDQMVHSSDYDTGVIMSNLEGHYYNKLVGAKRIIT